MTVGIGLGLLLNLLIWTVAVLVAVGLAALAVIEYFPGRERKSRKGIHERRGGAPDAGSRVEKNGTGERYRKAS